MTAQMLVNKDDTSKHARLDGEKSKRPQPYTKSYRQLRKARSERGRPPQGRSHQLVVLCQTAPKTHILIALYKTNRLYLEICLCICYICVYTYTIYTYIEMYGI